MADQKITALTSLTTLTDDDLLPVVDDPAGTPVTKRITVANFRKSFGEDDADGRRVPLVDTTGTIKGYVGYSTSANGVAIWLGGPSGIIDGDVPFISFDANGAIYMQSDRIYISSAGVITVQGTTVKLVSDSANGVDGTATPSTAAELADVLVDLGVIASHTIP